MANARDSINNLLNIIHHQLEGAALSEQFAAEAESRGDPELEEFFSEVSKTSHQRAERARELLADRRELTRPRVVESVGQSVPASRV